MNRSSAKGPTGARNSSPGQPEARERAAPPRTDKSDLGSPTRLRFPLHEATFFILAGPHYPENVGAAARAMKTMGFTNLRLVKPSRLALPTSEAAERMAVRAWDVLDHAALHQDLESALSDLDFVVATSGRSGHSMAEPPPAVAVECLRRSALGERIGILFGNEKTGLTQAELERAHSLLRIPMAADQPSINLAQAVQIVAYELFAAALRAR